MAGITPFGREVVDAIDEPAMVVASGIVQAANVSAQRLFGGQIEGRDVRLAIRQPQALERILGHEAAEVDVTGIVDLGRSWRLVIRPLRAGSVLLRMFDRSDAVSAEKMRVDFVANASHELRTPLSTITGYAETLADDAELPDELRARFGAHIRDEARRMLRIIEDLMSLSRIEADRFVSPSDTVHMAEVINAALANAAHLRGSTQCDFVVSLPGHLPPLRGDRAQLIQLVDNLLNNAVRYGCDRNESKVEVSAVNDGRWVTLTVTDHGPGIAREHLPRLTERFYRADPARSRETGGTGLGLAIVKHIVERHRGTLEIKSTPGVGTSVSVRLPLVS